MIQSVKPAETLRFRDEHFPEYVNQSLLTVCFGATLVNMARWETWLGRRPTFDNK